MSTLVQSCTAYDHLRRWQRHAIDLPVQVVLRDGPSTTVIPGRGVEISAGGMALYAGIPLQPNDLMEIEFKTPSYAHVTGIVRNRSGFCFGLEFLSPLPIYDPGVTSGSGECVAPAQVLPVSRPLARKALSPEITLFLRRHFSYVRERALEANRLQKEIDALRRVARTLYHREND